MTVTNLHHVPDACVKEQVGAPLAACAGILDHRAVWCVYEPALELLVPPPTTCTQLVRGNQLRLVLRECVCGGEGESSQSRVECRTGQCVVDVGGRVGGWLGGVLWTEGE